MDTYSPAKPRRQWRGNSYTERFGCLGISLFSTVISLAVLIFIARLLLR